MTRAPTPRWLVAYVLLGLVQSGMIPIVLPLAARPGPEAGFTYAAFALSGVAAPFIGAWSDRRRLHRRTLAGGLVLAGVGCFLHALPGGLGFHMATAALIGLGAASASTVASMFIVEVEPEASWDASIGRLQACLSAGQLVGLPLAGLLGLRHVTDALVLCGLLLFGAVPVALRYAPDPVQLVPRPTLRPRPPRSGDAGAIGAQRQMHRPTAAILAGVAGSPMAWFLATWLLSYTATNGLSVMIAVAMVRLYGASATLPTAAYAIGVGLSLLLYRRVGGWDTRFGAWRVLRLGLAIRVALIAAMLVLAVAARGHAAVLPILLFFCATQIVWPLLSVASTSLAVTLSPGRRAESAGLLNACTSVGATLGGITGGLLLDAGFAVLCGVVLLAVASGLLLSFAPPAQASAARGGRAPGEGRRLAG